MEMTGDPQKGLSGEDKLKEAVRTYERPNNFKYNLTHWNEEIKETIRSIQELQNKRKSEGDWANYWTLGTADRIEQLRVQYEMTGDSVDLLNLILLGLPEDTARMIVGAIFPERPGSFAHTMDVIGTGSLVYSGVKGFKSLGAGKSVGVSGATGFLDKGLDLTDDAVRRSVSGALDDLAKRSVTGVLDDADDVAKNSLMSGIGAVDDVVEEGSKTTRVPGKIIGTASAEDVNNWWKTEMGYNNPPYKLGTTVYEIKLTQNTSFVRVYNGETSGQFGGWLMKVEDIQGLTASQIQNKFSLPSTPKYVTDVLLPEGTIIREGIVNPLEGWGTGGGIQYDLIGQRIGEFVNPRPLQ